MYFWTADDRSLGNCSAVFCSGCWYHHDRWRDCGRGTTSCDGLERKKSVLGRDIYNDSGVSIGKIEDVIIFPEKNVTCFIVSVGGFIGMGAQNVAIPV